MSAALRNTLQFPFKAAGRSPEGGGGVGSRVTFEHERQRAGNAAAGLAGEGQPRL